MNVREYITLKSLAIECPNMLGRSKLEQKLKLEALRTFERNATSSEQAKAVLQLKRIERYS